MENINDMNLDWGSVIELDDNSYVLLDEGDYIFTVTNFERGRFNGGAKIPPCNKAMLTLSIDSEQGTASIKTDLILSKMLEWKLSSFFRSIGQKQKGEKLVMDWNKVIGAKGRCHIKVRTYTDKNGKEQQTNDVDKFLDWVGERTAVTPANSKIFDNIESIDL